MKIDEKKCTKVVKKAHIVILLSIGYEVLRKVANEKTAKTMWEKLEDLYLKKSLENRFYLKEMLICVNHGG